jgi:hypothetical protein
MMKVLLLFSVFLILRGTDGEVTIHGSVTTGISTFVNTAEHYFAQAAINTAGTTMMSPVCVDVKWNALKSNTTHYNWLSSTTTCVKNATQERVEGQGCARDCCAAYSSHSNAGRGCNAPYCAYGATGTNAGTGCVGYRCAAQTTSRCPTYVDQGDFNYAPADCSGCSPTLDNTEYSDCCAVKQGLGCLGEQCAWNCSSNHCGQSCVGEECALTCQGNECGNSCFGTSCAKGCTGNQCGAHCDGTNCSRDSRGSLSGSGCLGSGCAHNCSGVKCGQQCIGYQCAKNCVGENCGKESYSATGESAYNCTGIPWGATDDGSGTCGAFSVRMLN